MSEELPKFKSLDAGIDFLIVYLHRFSEDLWEKEFYVDKRWVEIRNDIKFQETILHVFEDDGKYLRILDGDVFTGTWKYSLGGLVIKLADQHELYERVFLNEKFFILKKHGEHNSKGNRPKYFFVVTESLTRTMEKILGRKVEWTDFMPPLYEIYKSNTSYMLVVFLLFLAIIGIVLLSIM